MLGYIFAGMRIQDLGELWNVNVYGKQIADRFTKYKRFSEPSNLQSIGSDEIKRRHLVQRPF